MLWPSAVLNMPFSSKLKTRLLLIASFVGITWHAVAAFGGAVAEVFSYQYVNSRVHRDMR